MENYHKLINEWNEFISEHLNTCRQLLENENNQIHDLYSEYIKSKKDVPDPGFNVFTITSDFYYRETYHSDIIKAFLDPSEKHGDGNLFLFKFINLLSSSESADGSKNSIDVNNYKGSKVTREEGKIDILIKDDASKSAIIIENKLNNASDTYRQLPKYYNAINGMGYNVEAIVYIPLDRYKTPTDNDWTPKEKKKIKSILHIIPGYSLDDKIINLVNDWISPCIDSSNNIDNISILRQYNKLLKYLTLHTMDTTSLKGFYDLLQNEHNYDTAISIRDMLNDLPKYLATRIYDKYLIQCRPYSKIWIYKETDAVFEGFAIDQIYTKMDITCSERGYQVSIYSRDDETVDIKSLFKGIKSVEQFNYKPDTKSGMSHNIPLFDNGKDGIFDFIDEFLKEICEKANNTNK